MSSERSASAITSLPKPGALAPAGVGRSRPATVGSAALVLARAVADWDGVMAGISSAVGGFGGRLGRIQPDRGPLRNRARSHGIAGGRRTRVSAAMPCAAALARYPVAPRSKGMSFARAAFGGTAAAKAPAMTPMQVARAMLSGGCLALTLRLAFDFQRSVDRLSRIVGRRFFGFGEHWGGCRSGGALSVGRDRRR